MSNSEMYQIVMLTLSDGRVVSFTGKAFCEKTDEDVTVVNIQITEPMPLPNDMRFEPMSVLVDESNKDNDV
jgi:alpha-acetolactate decarboxylase